MFDFPLVAFLPGILLAFTLLPMLFNIKMTNSIILTILGSISAFYTAGIVNVVAIVIVTGNIELPKLPWLHIGIIIYALLFHLVTSFLPKQSSRGTLQNWLLILTIPLTLLTTLPTLNLLINSENSTTRNFIARQFFGYNIEEGKNAIERCQTFMKAYGPFTNLKVKEGKENPQLAHFSYGHALNYEFSNTKGNGTLRLNSDPTSETKKTYALNDPSYSLLVISTYHPEKNLLTNDNDSIQELTNIRPPLGTFIYRIHCNQ